MRSGASASVPAVSRGHSTLGRRLAASVWLGSSSCLDHLGWMGDTVTLDNRAFCRT
jgi:hypothetical protein